jgi:hypothetical protein
MRQLDPIDRRFNHVYVACVHASIVIEVIHAPVSVSIHDHVDSIAILMPAFARAAARIAKRKII